MTDVKGVEIWDTMEKLYGNDGKIRPIEVLCSTGSYALDEAIGLWGIPKGKLIQYAGKESSGKTLMSLLAIKEWQKLGSKNWAVFIDAEYSFNEAWARILGVDMERLRVVSEENGTEIFTLLCGVPNKEIGKDKSKLGLLDVVKEKGGCEASGLGLIILDSIACVKSPIEGTKEVGHTNISPMARFLPDALRRLKPLLGQTGVTFIAINQVRCNPGKLFGDPMTTPGGQAWKHACDIMVHFTMSESKKSQFFNENDEPYGHIAGARTDKNKFAPPRCKCNFDIQYVSGVANKHVEVAKLAIKHNIVDRPNNRTYAYGDKKWTSKDEFYAAFTDEAFMHDMLNEIKKAKEEGLKNKVVKRDEDSDDGWAQIVPNKEEE